MNENTPNTTTKLADLPTDMDSIIGQYLDPRDAARFTQATSSARVGELTIAPETNVAIQLAAFESQCKLTFNDPALTEKQKIDIYIVLKKLAGPPENWADLFNQFVVRALNDEEMKTNLLTICRKDSAMAYRVMHTPLINAVLPAIQNLSLSYKILGGLIGFSAALLKPLEHLRSILYTTLMTTFFLIILPLILLPLIITLFNRGNPSKDIKSFVVDKSIGIAIFLTSPILLLVSMADAIYQGYKLGAKKAWNNYHHLLTYDERSRGFRPSHHIIYPPSDSNRHYFKPLYPTVADMAGDYQPPKLREEKSNAPISGLYRSLEGSGNRHANGTRYCPSLFRTRETGQLIGLTEPLLNPGETLCEALSVS